MDIKKDIFTKKLICVLGMVTLLSAQGAFAATSNGCDNIDKNDRINPEIALCSTHVYNIGRTENPKSESQKQLMRDVVALKSTVMTQQMYKQYEYLESMMKRFKTQLEKAVLTTKLQAAGADNSASSTSSSGGGYSGGISVSRDRNSYAVIDGANDCNLIMDKLSALQCVQGNLSVVLSALNDRKTSEAANQLKKDVEVFKSWLSDKDTNTPTKCGYLSGDSRVRDCLTDMRSRVANAIDNYKKDKIWRRLI